jgi:fatty acid desaturase
MKTATRGDGHIVSNGLLQVAATTEPSEPTSLTSSRADRRLVDSNFASREVDKNATGRGSSRGVASQSDPYLRLKAAVAAAGILNRSLCFYVPLILFTFAGYVLSVVAIILLDDYLALTLACLSFSFFTVQQAGLMHDSGHRAVFRSRKFNNLLGLASCAAIGMVLQNWMRRHNRHHLHPNQEELDPDLEIPFIAVTKDLYRNKRGLQRSLARWQVLYYYPIGSLVSLTNRLGSLSYFLRNRSHENIWLFCLYLPAIIAIFVLPFILFSIEKATFVFLLVHVSSGIYLSSCFAPNHKGMPVVGRDTTMSHFEQQVVTSRNVQGGLLTDFLLVGLNHQVEHHLFPSCPRNKLGLLKPYVLRACEELGLDYAEATFLESNRLILRQLREVSRAAEGQ